MLIEGKIKATIFISEIQFTINMDYTISGKNQFGVVGKDWSIAYWRFKFNNAGLRRRYGGYIIEQVKEITTKMGIKWDTDIVDFSNIEPSIGHGIKEYIMMDITGEDLYKGEATQTGMYHAT